MPKLKKILNNRDAIYLQPLVKLMEAQDKVTLVNWAICYSEQVMLQLWNKYYPEDLRPQNALKAAKAWLSGDIKLPEAKTRILECHSAARDVYLNPAAQAAARAIAQSASTIHCAGHCMGLPLYGALAVAYDEVGTDVSQDSIDELVALECERMFKSLCSYDLLLTDI